MVPVATWCMRQTHLGQVPSLTAQTWLRTLGPATMLDPQMVGGWQSSWSTDSLESQASARMRQDGVGA